jgi:hypothetical protein
MSGTVLTPRLVTQGDQQDFVTPARLESFEIKGLVLLSYLFFCLRILSFMRLRMLIIQHETPSPTISELPFTAQTERKRQLVICPPLEDEMCCLKS